MTATGPTAQRIARVANLAYGQQEPRALDELAAIGSQLGIDELFTVMYSLGHAVMVKAFDVGPDDQLVLDTRGGDIDDVELGRRTAMRFLVCCGHGDVPTAHALFVALPDAHSSETFVRSYLAMVGHLLRHLAALHTSGQQ